MTTIRRISAIGLFMMFAAAAFAQQPPPGIGLSQGAPTGEPLTRDGILEALAAYKDMVEQFDGLEPGEQVQGLPSYMKANDQLDKANAVARRHGFDDWMGWYRTFARVGQAYMAVKMEGARGGEPDLDQQIAMIKDNPNLTDQQKRDTIEMLKSSQNMMQSMMSASPTDIEAVRPLVPQLDRAFDEQQKSKDK